MSDRLKQEKKYFQASVRGDSRSIAQSESLIDLKVIWSCLQSSRELTKYKGFRVAMVLKARMQGGRIVGKPMRAAAQLELTVGKMRICFWNWDPMINLIQELCATCSGLVRVLSKSRKEMDAWSKCLRICSTCVVQSKFSYHCMWGESKPEIKVLDNYFYIF